MNQMQEGQRQHEALRVLKDNFEFFAAPFQNSNTFAKWSEKNPGMVELSNLLWSALNSSKGVQRAIDSYKWEKRRKRQLELEKFQEWSNAQGYFTGNYTTVPFQAEFPIQQWAVDEIFEQEEINRIVTAPFTKALFGDSDEDMPGLKDGDDEYAQMLLAATPELVNFLLKFKDNPIINKWYQDHSIERSLLINENNKLLEQSFIKNLNFPYVFDKEMLKHNQNKIFTGLGDANCRVDDFQNTINTLKKEQKKIGVGEILVNNKPLENLQSNSQFSQISVNNFLLHNVIMGIEIELNKQNIQLAKIEIEIHKVIKNISKKGQKLIEKGYKKEGEQAKKLAENLSQQTITYFLNPLKDSEATQNFISNINKQIEKDKASLAQHLGFAKIFDDIFNALAQLGRFIKGEKKRSADEHVIDTRSVKKLRCLERSFSRLQKILSDDTSAPSNKNVQYCNILQEAGNNNVNENQENLSNSIKALTGNNSLQSPVHTKQKAGHSPIVSDSNPVKYFQISKM